MLKANKPLFFQQISWSRFS